MRVYYRTSRNTGVSLGCFGTALVALFWMALLGLPIWLAEQVFRHWYVGVPVALLVLLVVVIAVASKPRREP